MGMEKEPISIGNWSKLAVSSSVPNQVRKQLHYSVRTRREDLATS